MIDLNNDRILNIALGDNRKSINWKNTSMLWSKFLERISYSEDTGESYQHYMSASKEKQDNIKDIGGFVGGKLKGKKRKASEVVSRSMLTLDADFAKDDLWDNFTMLNDYAAAIYSTHKHSNEAPRYRLIIPLARDVTPQEYEAIGRKIADDIGIDYFDDTTYQVNRLMYWPSHSTDGDVFFDKQDGKFLNPDEVLSRYDDWQDRSQWPRSSREKKDAKTFGARAKKQGDPLEKDGLIGAFCRAYYPIDEAIEEFLSDVYIKCDMPNRYTYAEGSSSAGLVIYDDVFAYSNHATDPCSKKLCNAFDLVRIHKFGELDKEMPEGTAVTSLPSHNAMLEFAQNDKQTKLERLKQTQEDFEEKYKNDLKPKIESISAQELETMKLEPVKFIVEDMITTGLTILASPPKFGKSWAVLDLCLSVSMGKGFLGHKTYKCDSYYLALEDSLNRLKGRMSKILGLSKAPDNLYFTISANDLSMGLLKDLEEFMKDHPQTGLIVIDTFQKIRGQSGGRESVYGADYREAGLLKKFADAHKIAIVLVHHTAKKFDSTDAFSRISGTNGLTGAADTMIVLGKESRKDTDTHMHITGRDVNMNEFIIVFDKNCYKWILKGTAEEIEAIKECEKYENNPIVITIKGLLKDSENKWKGSIADILDKGEYYTGGHLVDYEKYQSDKARVTALATQIGKLKDDLFNKDGIEIEKSRNGSKRLLSISI